MIEVILRGNTYGIKNTLKNLGFKWVGAHNCWMRIFEDDEEAEANEIATRWNHEGVYGRVTKY